MRRDCWNLQLRRSTSSAGTRSQSATVVAPERSSSGNYRGPSATFADARKHVRLHINAQAAKTEGLTISAKLLRVAQVITAEKD
jgi:YfiR/HmsC-like